MSTFPKMSNYSFKDNRHLRLIKELFLHHGRYLFFHYLQKNDIFCAASGILIYFLMNTCNHCNQLQGSDVAGGKPGPLRILFGFGIWFVCHSLYDYGCIVVS